MRGMFYGFGWVLGRREPSHHVAPYGEGATNVAWMSEHYPFSFNSTCSQALAATWQIFFLKKGGTSLGSAFNGATHVRRKNVKICHGGTNNPDPINSFQIPNFCK